MDTNLHSCADAYHLAGSMSSNNFKRQVQRRRYDMMIALRRHYEAEAAMHGAELPVPRVPRKKKARKHLVTDVAETHSPPTP